MTQVIFTHAHIHIPYCYLVWPRVWHLQISSHIAGWSITKMADIYQAAEDLKVEDIYDTFTICPMTEEEEMYEDIDALRAAINAPSTPVAPPPIPTNQPPSKPPSGPSRPLPQAPSAYNKYTPGFPGPKTTTPGYPGPSTSSTTNTTASSVGFKTTTPGYPGPSAAPPTTTTARQSPAAPPNTSSWKPPPPSDPPSSTIASSQRGLPKWPPSAAKNPDPPKPKAVDRPENINNRKSNKPQPATDGKFYCGVCREEIVVHQGIVTHQDNIWHSFCFKCFVCKKPLRGVQFVHREREVHCYECFLRNYAPRCNICNQNITGNDGMKLQGKAYHRKCFTCSACGGELAGKKFTMEERKPFCYDCYLKLYSKRCGMCNEYITGAYVDLGEVAYHEDCFKCSICKGMFTDGMMYKNSEGEFACSTCASVL